MLSQGENVDRRRVREIQDEYEGNSRINAETLQDRLCAIFESTFAQGLDEKLSRTRSD